MTDTPTNVQSVVTEDNTVQLTWSSPASNTPPVAGYEVFYAVSGSDVTQSGGNTDTSTTTISVILPSQSDIYLYDFFVVAFSDADKNALPSAHSENSTVYLRKFNYTNGKAIVLKEYSEINCNGPFERLCMIISN